MGKFSQQDYFNIFGWGVGNKEYLSSEESKVALYYRLIEDGTKGFIGRQIAGVFEDKGGKPQPFGARDPSATFRSLAPSPSESESNLARGARAGLHLLVTAYGKGSTGGKNRNGTYRGEVSATRGVVQHEILPHEIYKTAAASFDVLAREKAAIIKAFEAIGITGNITATARADTLSKPRPAKQEVRAGALQGFFKVSVLSGTNQALARQGGAAGVGVNRAGTFTTFVTQLRQANFDLALEFQQKVVETLTDSLVRPGASSGRLKAATESDKNRVPRSPGVGA